MRRRPRFSLVPLVYNLWSSHKTSQFVNFSDVSDSEGADTVSKGDESTETVDETKQNVMRIWNYEMKTAVMKWLKFGNCEIRECINKYKIRRIYIYIFIYIEINK